MELPGTGYLYNLTLISVTFAGFSALITAFRQMVGGRFTKYDAFLIRSALVSSLIVIVCALLPPLLALFELSAAIIWRLSSLSAGINYKTNGDGQTHIENSPRISRRAIVDGDVLADAQSSPPPAQKIFRAGLFCFAR
jgi:hypothetical protein